MNVLLLTEGRQDWHALANMLEAADLLDEGDQSRPIASHRATGHRAVFEGIGGVETKRAKNVKKIVDKVSARVKSTDFNEGFAAGVVLDGDDDPSEAWTVFQQAVEGLAKDLPGSVPAWPSSQPAEGYVFDLNDPEIDGLQRLGLWIMPDNGSPGAIESFLLPLRRESPLAWWANAATGMAERFGAVFSKPTATSGKVERDRGKAQMHTWLAWQQPPGLRFGEAASKQLIKANQPFLNWFDRLSA